MLLLTVRLGTSSSGGSWGNLGAQFNLVTQNRHCERTPSGLLVWESAWHTGCLVAWVNAEAAVRVSERRSVGWAPWECGRRSVSHQMGQRRSGVDAVSLVS